MQRLQHRIGEIDLELLHSEVSAPRILMVIILEELAHQNEVPWSGVAGMVVRIPIAVAVFVPHPVDGGSVHGTHEEVNGKQNQEKWGGSEAKIKERIKNAEDNAHHPAVANLLQHGPLRIVFVETLGKLVEFPATRQAVLIDFLGVPHHLEHVLKEVWRMGIIFRIAVSMVHAMEHRVATGIEKAGPLTKKGNQKEELLPKVAHFKHTVGRIPMQEERLTKGTEEPVKKEETDYYPSAGPKGNIEQHKL